MKAFFILALIVLCVQISVQPAKASPKKSTKQKPESINGEKIVATVIYGDKKISYRIWSEENGKHFFVATSNTDRSEGELSAKNKKFITEKAAEIMKETTNKKSHCTRNSMSLKVTVDGVRTERIGCIGSKTPVAQKLTELSNILGFLF